MSAAFDERPPTLPAGWYWATMGDIAEVIGGGTPRTTDRANFEGGDVPWITPADLSGYTEKFISRGARFITRRGLESSSARLLPAGTVLFTSRAPIGYVAIARNPVATNQGFKSFVLKDGVLPDYVYWWLKGSKQRAEALASGTTFLELSGTNAKKLPIPIAPVEEQHRIVAEIEKHLSRLDEAVATLQRVKANLARQLAAVLNAAVFGHLTGTREPLWPRALNVGDALPDGWCWRTAEELAASDQGSIGAGPFGTIFKAKDFRPAGVPIIFLRHVAPMRYLRDKPGFMDAEKWAELFRPYSVFGGELLITKLGEPPGACAMYPAGIGPAMVTPDVIKMRVDEDIAVPAYLMYYFNSEVAKRFATGAAFGTTRTRLTLPLFRAMPVVVPPRDQQERIVAEVDRRISIVREVEAELDANLSRAQALRQAVLASAFSQRSGAGAHA